jgi:hypothetical protein
VPAARDGSLNGDGFRFYRWADPKTGEPTDVLSVTSIRRLCGEPYMLVAWQLANLADCALGTQKRQVIGPRGGVSEKRTVFEYPSDFMRRYTMTEGKQDAIDALRKWLRQQADEPRNVAAMRGTMTHEAIEKDVPWDRIERPYVEDAFAKLSSRDRVSVARDVVDEDVNFVRNSVRHYWDMRQKVRMVIVAREVQVYNLSAGYAGTADALVWLLPDGVIVPEHILKHPDSITIDTVRQWGGELAIFDWKTATDLHTDNVVQAHAYLAAEFVGHMEDEVGVIDHRLTDLLQAAQWGGLAHIRPDGWKLALFPFDPAVVRAFLGSVAFARFLAQHPSPQPIFTKVMAGASEEEEVYV